MNDLILICLLFVIIYYYSILYRAREKFIQNSNMKQKLEKYPELKEFNWYFEKFKDKIEIIDIMHMTVFRTDTEDIDDDSIEINDDTLTDEEELQILYVRFCKGEIKDYKRFGCLN